MFRRSVSLGKSIAILTAAFLLSAAAMVYLTPKAHGAEVFDLPKPSCYPISPSDVLAGKVVDVRLNMKAEVDVFIWWCNTPTGMVEHYRAGNFGTPCEECFRIDLASLSTDTLFAMDRAAFHRYANEAELARVHVAEAMYEPRCLINSTAATTQVLTATADRQIGPARLDDKGTIVRVSTAAAPSCYDWIRVGTSKVYCSAQGLKDTKAREIAPAGYVPCKVTTAPESGWPGASA